MKTDDLIKALSADAATRQPTVAEQAMWALPIAIGISALLFSALLGVRADIANVVSTWRFDGWPDVEAVESVDLHESDGVTTMRNMMTFSDRADRDRMIPSEFDGVEASFDHLDAHLRSLTGRS